MSEPLPALARRWRRDWPSGMNKANREPCSAMRSWRASGVTSDAMRRGSSGTANSEARSAAVSSFVMAVSRASAVSFSSVAFSGSSAAAYASDRSRSAFFSAAFAADNRPRAIRRPTPPASVRRSSWTSSRGARAAANTEVLRSPGSATMRTHNTVRSTRDPQAFTRTRPTVAAERTDRTTDPITPSSTPMDEAAERTNSAALFGSASVGNVARGAVSVSGRGSSHASPSSSTRGGMLTGTVRSSSWLFVEWPSAGWSGAILVSAGTFSASCSMNYVAPQRAWGMVPGGLGSQNE